MIKVEIYWIFGNRLRKISPKLLPQKAKVYLENFLKIDFNEYPKYIHEAVAKKEIIYIENIFEDERAVDERELAKKQKENNFESDRQRKD